MLLTICNGIDVFVLRLALWLLALGRKQWLIPGISPVSLSGSILDRVNNSRSQTLCSEISKQCARGVVIASKTEGKTAICFKPSMKPALR
ncbi:hypothetical protein Peur_052224 [Populus x canadensis]